MRGASDRHVVAVAGGDRDGGDGLNAELCGKASERSGDLAEAALVEVDEIHLVYREDHVADAEQRDDRRVPPRLCEQPLGGIDEEDCKIGGRSAGRHVARVLNMARRVGDDEAAVRRGEEAVGDVDGDALLALRLEPVDEKREVDRLAGRAVLQRVRFEVGELVLHQEMGIVEEPADQRRLAVVDAAAGQEPQRVGGLRRADGFERERFLVHGGDPIHDAASGNAVILGRRFAPTREPRTRRGS